MVSVMAFTSRAPRLQTSADRYYRFFDEGQQIGVDLVVRFENASMQKYDPGKPAIMASNHARQECRYALGMALCRGSACPGRECAARSGGLDAEWGPLTRKCAARAIVMHRVALDYELGRLLRTSRNSLGPLRSRRLRRCRSSSVADGSLRRSISWPAIARAFSILSVRAPARWALGPCSVAMIDLHSSQMISATS
jgi:hypothetical protein